MSNLLSRILGGRPGPEEPWRKESAYVGNRYATNAERAEAVAGRADWLRNAPEPTEYIAGLAYSCEIRDAVQAVVAYTKEDMRNGR